MLVSRHCAGENNKHTLYIRILCQTVPSGYTEMESGPRSVTVVLVKVGQAQKSSHSHHTTLSRTVFKLGASDGCMCREAEEKLNAANKKLAAVINENVAQLNSSR